MSVLVPTTPLVDNPKDKDSYSVPILQNGEIDVALELQAVWSRIEADRTRHEAGHEQLESLLNELHKQKNLLLAQTVVNSAIAKAVDEQMLELRKTVRTGLTSCHEQCDQIQNQTRKALTNLAVDVQELKATKADKLEIVNETGGIYFAGLKELWSDLQSLEESTELITVEMTKTSDQIKVHIGECNEQRIQGLSDLKKDVEEFRIEAKKCNEQCVKNENFCVQENLVDSCEKGVAFVALESQEKADAVTQSSRATVMNLGMPMFLSTPFGIMTHQSMKLKGKNGEWPYTRSWRRKTQSSRASLAESV